MKTILKDNKEFFAENPKAYPLLEYWPEYVKASPEIQRLGERIDSPSLAGFNVFMVNVLQNAGALPIVIPRDVEVLALGQKEHALAEIREKATDDEPTVNYDMTEHELATPPNIIRGEN